MTKETQAKEAPANEASVSEVPVVRTLWGSVWAYRLIRLGLGLFCALGIGLMLYPALQRVFFTVRSMELADEYQAVLDATDDEVIEHEWVMAQEYNRARVYNEMHDVNTITDPFAGDARTKELNDEYWSLVNPMGNGMMGYMDIPRIGQRLNIYHGTDDDALLKGIGHIQGTSLPVGGKGTHCILSGHRGLPGAKILTDVDQMEIGDLIRVHVLNHNLAYEVDQILTVKPEEISAVDIIEGADLLTLVSCTPYAVNTHRLLVRGHRVPYVEEDPTLMQRLWPYRWLILGLLLVVIIVLVRRWRRRRAA